LGRERLSNTGDIFRMDDGRALGCDRRVHVPPAVLRAVHMKAEEGVKTETGAVWRAMLCMDRAQGAHQRDPVDRPEGHHVDCRI
jgi:hypothetical protein